MDDQIIIRGRLINKNHILDKPDFFRDTSMMVFLLPEEYRIPMTEYYKNHKMEDMELTIRDWPKTPQERAKHLFFAIRDRIAIDQNGPQVSREDKDHLYHSCIEELDIWHEGRKINSIKDLNKRELHVATELMIQWAYEAEVDISDLVPEVRAVRKEIKG